MNAVFSSCCCKISPKSNTVNENIYANTSNYSSLNNNSPSALSRPERSYAQVLRDNTILQSRSVDIATITALEENDRANSNISYAQMACQNPLIEVTRVFMEFSSNEDTAILLRDSNESLFNDSFDVKWFYRVRNNGDEYTNVLIDCNPDLYERIISNDYTPSGEIRNSRDNFSSNHIHNRIQRKIIEAQKFPKRLPQVITGRHHDSTLRCHVYGLLSFHTINDQKQTNKHCNVFNLFIRNFSI